jgi:hypothetical protein
MIRERLAERDNVAEARSKAAAAIGANGAHSSLTGLC